MDEQAMEILDSIEDLLETIREAMVNENTILAEEALRTSQAALPGLRKILERYIIQPSPK